MLFSQLLGSDESKKKKKKKKVDIIWILFEDDSLTQKKGINL